MSAVLGRLGRTLPVAVAALTLGACSNSVAPSAAPRPEAVAAAAGEQEPGASITVQGRVVDSSGRPLTFAQVECMGDVKCVGALTQVIAQDGPDDGFKTNSAGAFVLVATRNGASNQFLMSATAKGYELMIRQVAFADPTCTSDRAACTVNVDFTLAPQAQ